MEGPPEAAYDSLVSVLEPEVALWEKIGHLFTEDDGALPEVELKDLMLRGAERIYRALLAAAPALPETVTLWSLAEGREVLLREVRNPVGEVFAGRIEHIYFDLNDVVVGSVLIPPLGVAVFPGQIALDYSARDPWNATVLAAFARLLGSLRALDAGGRLAWWEATGLTEVSTLFVTAVEQFLSATTPGRRP